MKTLNWFLVGAFALGGCFPSVEKNDDTAEADTDTDADTDADTERIGNITAV